MIQQHHGGQPHWDVRVRRGGDLVSFAVPLGLPCEPGVNRLAVCTDHPVAGEPVTEWDRGSCAAGHWNDDRVEVTFHGERARGRYVFVNVHGEGDRHWIVRRVDPAPAGWRPLPVFVPPMLARPGLLPKVDEDEQWAYGLAGGGVRAVARVQDGWLVLRDAAGEDITARYPELRGLGERLAGAEVLLDGEIVTPRGGRPAVYLVHDLLHVDGLSCLDLPYAERRALLDGLDLAGAHWRVCGHYVGDPATALRVAHSRGLAGVVARRLGSRYRPGRTSPDWLAVDGVYIAEVVVGGWRPGSGRRSGTFGSLLLGLREGGVLRYVGNVGSGFSTEELAWLTGRLNEAATDRSPFHSVPEGQAAAAYWVRPSLVAEVVHRGWTNAGCLRNSRWRGLR
ncbi:DNA polymerase ligase N-terminal domain-containing protein [Amycolatopsis suaedae]|uniref:ATP dependent DNA ligase n=1 Tax=Amycolatopsis suaedae TaxID=2510978 RepID=UPI001F10E414|nr:DNA polymerase ligase N-terminal domain-containing protein [Amycolatopsis suaedae]